MTKIVSDSKKNNFSSIFLTISVVILCILGLIFIYSASNYTALNDYNDSFFFVKKQVIGYGIGLACYLFTSNFNYLKYKKISVYFVIISVVLLALVLTPLGREVYGAKRWISLGSFTIQPSELAKLSFIIFTASYFSNDMYRVKKIYSLLPVIAVGITFCLLIMAEPNMSITVCMGLLLMAMLFVSGISLKFFAVIIILVALALPVLIIIEPYRLNRLYAFLDPWSSPKGEGYQLLQSLYALGSGGFFGVGIFKSRQKLKFLPFSESDFILSIIGEEIGFIGLFLLFLFFVFIAVQILKIAVKSRDFFGYLLCVGIDIIFLIQIFLNALVVTGSIPPTGLPLPVISSGNTQIIVFLSAFGIVNNVSKNLQN